MGSVRVIGTEMMTMAEFDNERVGNDCRWRVIENESRRKRGVALFFVYRRIDRGDGFIITEYLHKNGKIDSVCCDEGSFADLSEVGLAFVRLQDRLDFGSDARTDNHAAYLRRFNTVDLTSVDVLV